MAVDNNNYKIKFARQYLDYEFASGHPVRCLVEALDEEIIEHKQIRLQLHKNFEEYIDDKQRLARELDVAMNGEAGAAKQASLCDLVAQAEKIRSTLDEMYNIRQGCIAEIEDLKETLRDIARSQNDEGEKARKALFRFHDGGEQ
jgi:rubrerythrin